MKVQGCRPGEGLGNYQPRAGTSSVTGNKFVALRVGLAMLALIAKYRIVTAVRPLPSRVPDLR